MSDDIALTHAFLEAHPDDAARVLEHLTPGQAGALLSDLPVRLTLPVLARMLPPAAARCLEQLETEQAAAAIRGLGAQLGTGILRHFTEVRRNELLNRLPTATAMTLRMLLAYPDNSIGAWMDTRALALPADTTVAEALQRVRESTDINGDRLFIVDAAQRLQGQIALTELLRAPPTHTLVQIMHPARHTLPARAALKPMHDHAGWAHAASLPVVEHGERFVGTLHHPTLTRALSRHSEPHGNGVAVAALAPLADSYWTVFSGLIQAALSLFAQPAKTAEHNDER